MITFPFSDMAFFPRMKLREISHKFFNELPQSKETTGPLVAWLESWWGDRLQAGQGLPPLNWWLRVNL